MLIVHFLPWNIHSHNNDHHTDSNACSRVKCKVCLTSGWDNAVARAMSCVRTDFYIKCANWFRSYSMTHWGAFLMLSRDFCAMSAWLAAYILIWISAKEMNRKIVTCAAWKTCILVGIHIPSVSNNSRLKTLLQVQQSPPVFTASRFDC